jgi:thiol-disulfide isomerase/thioredoxin
MVVVLPSLLAADRVFAQEPKQEPKQEEKQEMKAEPPNVIAVEFYADWCSTCKVLMPKILEARKHLQGKPVLFVRFDMTDEFTKQQASYMAAFAGLEEVYRRGHGKTGMVALVDAKTKKVLSVIGQKKTPEEINVMFDEAVSKANAN